MNWKEESFARKPLSERAGILAERIKEGRVLLPELFDRCVAGMGRFRVSRDEIEVRGRFRLDRETLDDLARFVSDCMGLYRLFYGARLYLRVREVGDWRLDLGFPPKMSHVSADEAERSPLALVEVDLSILRYLFMGAEGVYLVMSEDTWKVRRLNALLDPVDNGWEDTARLFDPMASIMTLTRKQNAAILGPALTQWAEKVLSGLGV